MGDGVFQVDADAHAKAKAEGDYTPDGSGEKKDDTPADDKDGKGEKSPISDIDPGDAEDDTSDDAGEGDDDGEAGDKTEGGDDKSDDKDGDKDDKKPDFSANMQAWTDEFMDGGELSDETRTTISEAVFAPGVPKEVVSEYIDAYIAGLSSLRDAATQEAFDVVGGTEKYQAMQQWGIKNLTEAEMETFDKDALGTDKVKRDSAIKGLYARFQQAAGSEPDFEPDLTHDGGRQGGEPIIGSRQELVRIQRTKEYQTDEAVRAKVARQLRQSMDTGKYIS